MTFVVISPSVCLLYRTERCINSGKETLSQSSQSHRHVAQTRILWGGFLPGHPCCSTVSHCRGSVECRSSALIDFEAHDPASRVKGRLRCDFCRYSKLAAAAGERASTPATQTHPGWGYVNSSTPSQKLFSNESDSTLAPMERQDKAATSVHIGEANLASPIAPRRKRR